MGSTKRAWKLNEYVAHTGSINCLALGQRSGRVLVTGGDDKKVNMWSVGKPNCVMSLSGHTSPVEAVKFGNAEEMVVAGSLSGALKVWDLEAAKILRTLNGHKANIRSLDFHPYGDFVASGAMDTNVKLWDIRRRGCIFTYKGHTKCVNSLLFSPDGRWIASASDDQLIKIWDITAGKAIAELKLHTGPVTSIAFHPSEFLLASGSTDRTVKFWDLEKFVCADSTESDCGAVRTVAFHPEGVGLFSASSDHLKVFGWEPSMCHDSLSMGWGKVSDIVVAQGQQLIGATYNQNTVAVHIADLSRIAPFGKVPESATPTPASSSGRKSYMMDRPPTRSTNRLPSPSADLESFTVNTRQEKPPVPVTKKRQPGPTTTRRIPGSAAPKDETARTAQPWSASQPAEEPDDSANQGGDDPGDDLTSGADINDPTAYKEIFQPHSRLVATPPRHDPFPAPLDDEPVPKPVHREEKPYSGGPRKAAPATSQQRPPTSATKHSKPPSAARPATKVAPPPTVDAQDFLPKESGPAGKSDALAALKKGHIPMVTALKARQNNLQLVLAMWSSGNVKTAIGTVVQMNEQSVIVDTLNVLNHKNEAVWNLEVVGMLLPSIRDLLTSKYEAYTKVGCDSIKLVLRLFGPVIKQNMEAPVGTGVDISREERHRKCKECYRILQEIRSQLASKKVQGGLMGTFREIQLLMSNLD